MTLDLLAWTLRALLVIGALRLIYEGLFEIGTVKRYFYEPPSVPGYNKILEHFAFQHVIFPAAFLSLAFWPAWTLSYLDPLPVRAVLFAFLIVVAFAETGVPSHRIGALGVDVAPASAGPVGGSGGGSMTVLASPAIDVANLLLTVVKYHIPSILFGWYLVAPSSVHRVFGA